MYSSPPREPESSSPILCWDIPSVVAYIKWFTEYFFYESSVKEKMFSKKTLGKETFLSSVKKNTQQRRSLLSVFYTG
jgi:hypothetical protein